jgi:hypothetical protein
MQKPFVVRVHRHGQGPLGMLLADDVLIEVLGNLPRRRDIAQHRTDRTDLSAFLPEDILAQINAVGANVDLVWSLHHGTHFATGLSAKRAGRHPPATEASGIARAAAAGNPWLV